MNTTIQHVSEVLASFKSKYLDKNSSSRLLINFHYALNEKLFDNSSNINKTKTLYHYQDDGARF